MPEEPSASADPFEQRTRFGSFEILRTDDGKQLLLGKGAFGRTYKARHVFLERTVALKIINDKFLTDAKARERFLHEARAAAKLTHPHIAQILDFGETDGILYYAMEYCSGGDLADYVKRNGPLSVVQTVQIGLQVASALQCAHTAGFIHRDLKPSNLMLASPDGPIVTKLIDFGLVLAAPAEDAEPIDPDDMPTIEQRFIGTPLFASPEQLLVQPLDARSDFFALGMTLWFLILGTAPDQGNSASIVAARLKPDSYAPRLPRKLPQAFSAVIARLLEKKPENRFANATQLVAAFGKCAAGLGLPAGPTSAFVMGAVEGEEETGAAEPAALESIDAPVEECYTLQGQRGSNPTGADFEATALSDQSTVWLHFLKPAVVGHAKMLERVRKNIGFLQHRPLSAVVHPSALRAHTDRTIVVLEAPGGTDLLTASKSAGPIRLAEARPLLQAIANACDTLLAAGLPPPELEAHRVFLRQPSEFQTAATALSTSEARLLPQFLARSEVAAIEGAPPVADEPGWQFAVLVYRVLSGRNLPAKPVLTPDDCVAIPKLSEEANRLLAHAVARQLVHATCSELLADLLIAEGLMGATVTRTHATAGTTFSPASTHGGTSSSSGGATVPPPLTSGGDDPQITAAPAASPRTTQFAPPPSPPPIAAALKVPARAARPQPSIWPLIVGALLLMLLVFSAGAWLLMKYQSGGKLPFLTPTTVVHLHGDLPPHATARVGAHDARLERTADSMQVVFDGSTTTLPATVTVEAKGYAPLAIPLTSAGDLERTYDAGLKRSEGTLIFSRRGGSDYEHAVLKMTAQLPDEQAFVELERFNRGAELSAGEMKLPTGIYQVTLRGANERVVRPRVFNSVAIRPGESTTLEIPPPVAGSYAGLASIRRDGAREGNYYRVELDIDADITTGSFVEQRKQGPLRLPLADGRIDVEGVYLARIQYSLAPDGDAQFDQLCSLRRESDGTWIFSASEAPEENAVVERHLNRQPYAKAAYSVEGTLRPQGQ
jgi:tRNA A-37 threonylcarbamoyl transferase component Bud32